MHNNGLCINYIICIIIRNENKEKQVLLSIQCTSTCYIFLSILTIFFQQYKCSSVIDPVTVRSLVPDRLFSQWVYRQQEQAVMSTGNWKWCPSSTCDHILSVVSNSKCQETNGLIQFLSFIFCL